MVFTLLNLKIEFMNLSRTDIAENIEAYYDGTEPTAKDVADRIDYLISQLQEAQDIVDNDGTTEQDYAIGDTLNLLHLIKSKL